MEIFKLLSAAPYEHATEETPDGFRCNAVTIGPKIGAGDGVVRIAILSTKNEFGIAEYPDSDKVGVWAGEAYHTLRRSDHLDYRDGER